jgi:hypothetical protein
MSSWTLSGRPRDAPRSNFAPQRPIRRLRVERGVSAFDLLLGNLWEDGLAPGAPTSVRRQYAPTPRMSINSSAPSLCAHATRMCTRMCRRGALAPPFREFCLFLFRRGAAPFGSKGAVFEFIFLSRVPHPCGFCKGGDFDFSCSFFPVGFDFSRQIPRVSPPTPWAPRHVLRTSPSPYPP